VATKRGESGVSHTPVVVGLSAGPSVDRHAAERAIGSDNRRPRMTGKFEWLTTNVVQWVPDRLPGRAHSNSSAFGAGRRDDEFKTGAVRLRGSDIKSDVHVKHRRMPGGTASLPSAATHDRLLSDFGEAGCHSRHEGRPENSRTPVGTYSVISKDARCKWIRAPSDHLRRCPPPTVTQLTVDYAVRIPNRRDLRGIQLRGGRSMGLEMSSTLHQLSHANAEWYLDNVPKSVDR